MPNWVYNGLTIEGKSESITKLVSQLNQPFKRHHDSLWDFETKQFVARDILYPNPVFAFWNIVKPTDMIAYEKQPDHSLPIEEAMQFKGDHWYDWNVRNWGTKWDVAVSSEDEHPNTYMEGPVENGDNFVVFYNFNTAWGVPDAALTNLSSQYPDLLFTLSYEEETGWGGEIEYLRGETISEVGWESQCRDCDAKNCLEYCEDCENDVCSECGFGSEDVCETHKEKVDA
jgi:hypothetical protein